MHKWYDVRCSYKNVLYHLQERRAYATIRSNKKRTLIGLVVDVFQYQLSLNVEIKF